MNKSKSIFASKTFWANLLVPIITLVFSTFFKDEGLPEDTDGKIMLVIIFVQGVLNIVLRAVTKVPVTFPTTGAAFVFCLLFLTGVANADERYILHNQTGYWILTVPNAGEPVLEKPYVLGPGGGVSTPPGDNGGGNVPVPPTADRVKDISKIAAENIPVKAGKGLGVVFGTINASVQSGAIEEKDIGEAVTRIMNISYPVLGSKDAIETFFGQVRGLYGDWSKSLLNDTTKALTTTFPMDPEQARAIKSLMADPEDTEKTEAAEEVEEALDLGGFVVLLKMILQVLELLKNLDFGDTQVPVNELWRYLNDSPLKRAVAVPWVLPV